MEQDRFIIGTPGPGKGIHPWDNLEKCLCGNIPWICGRDGKTFQSGKPYKIVCNKCGNHTSYGSLLEIKKEWNTVRKTINTNALKEASI